MKNFFLGLVIGVVLSAAAFLYFSNSTIKVDVGHSHLQLGSSSNGTSAREALGSLDLNSTNIKDELSRMGAVIRRKATETGKAIADATADARITATIKGKYVADPNLSALSISVSTTAGMVTLSGTASSPENIQKAIQIAWDTDGVTGVVSTIQVKE